VKILSYLAQVIASTAFSGYFPIAPGTVGAAVAITVLFILPALSWELLTIASVVFFFVGVWATTEAEKLWGHDAGRINWDEVVGMMVTVVALPKHWISYFAAFIVFRFFDVVKPYPIGNSQKLPGGWGIMIDDVLAGVFSNILLQIFFRLLVHIDL
jgi:phosphatidylglycerophosphatase A